MGQNDEGAKRAVTRRLRLLVVRCVAARGAVFRHTGYLCCNKEYDGRLINGHHDKYLCLLIFT